MTRDRLQASPAAGLISYAYCSSPTETGYPMQQTCLNCGMLVDASMSHCPKCDNALDLQHDGSTITVDIAHQGERVHEALEKMQAEIEAARRGVAMSLRLVVGSGLIREQVLLALGDLEFRGDIKSFEQEPHNAGSVLVILK